MSTRFYLPGMIDTYAGSPIAGSSVWSGYNATWYSVADLLRDKSQLDSQNAFGLAENVGDNTPIVQFISGPLQAQTIAGTVKGVIRAYEDAGAMAQGAVVIRLVSNDGQTVRGTLLEYVPSSLTSEFITAGSTARNAFFPPPSTALTSQDAEDGDRLVIEVGYANFNPSYLDGGAYVKLGIQGGSDLAENETGQDTTLDPWIEFSQTIGFQVPPLDVVGDGGVQVGGGGTMVAIGVFRPLTLDVIASGWLTVSGGETYEVNYPTSWIESTEGVPLRVSGAGVVGMTKPAVTLIPGVIGVGVSGGTQVAFFRPLAIRASGGVQLGGRGDVVVSRPSQGDFIATGGLKVGSLDLPMVTCTRPDNTLLEIISTGAIGVGGHGRHSMFYPEITDIVPTPAEVRIGGEGGASVYYPPVMAIVSVGLPMILGGGNVEEAVYETWVITGVEHQPSIYSDFPFNSYAEFRGLHYGCADDGIYLMNQEGRGDDDGRKIHPGVRIGPTNFQAGTKKFIRTIHPGKSGDNTKVMVSTDKEDSYPIPHAGQFVGKREHVDDEFIIDISDFDKLGRIEIVPMILPRR